MEKQLIPAGYKQTELGVIPEDWKVLSLDEITTKVGSGKTPHGGSTVYIEYGVPLVRSQNVGWGRLILDDIAHISEDIHKTFLGSELKKGDVLLNITGASIGRSSIANDFLEGGNVNQHVCIIRVVSEVDPRTVNNFILSESGQSQIASYQAGGNREGLNFNQVKAMKFALPANLEEQTAIANALSDVDALIAALEKLINKKSAIKTAAMQQLLTGKKRLPPFDQLNTGYKQTELGEIPRDWEVIDFGDLFQPTITRQSIKKNILVSFIGMQDVSESAQLISPNVISYNEVKSGFTYFEKNDVLVAKITPCFENGKGCIAEKLETNIGFGSTEFHVLRANEKAVAKYIYFISTTGNFRKQLESEMVGSAGHRRVPMIAIEKYRIPCSNHFEEQTAIANVLSDMDKDLESLQQRLHKTQQIKQGMMQELLTGRARLRVNG